MEIVKYIIIFLPIILGLILGAWSIIEGYMEWVEFILLTLLSVLVTILYNVILFLIFSNTSVEYIPQENVKYELVATKFNNNIEGNFFLGIGSIENKECVNYTIKNGKEIVRKKIEQYQIFISDDQPYVEIKNVTKRTTTKSWLYNINKATEESLETEAIFYIPENSIVQNININ